MLNAADYGVPQLRERVFVVGTRLGHPFVFPKPTHCSRSGLTKGLQPYVTLGDAIGDLPVIESGESSEEYATASQNDYQARMREKSFGLMDHLAPRHCGKLLALLASLPDGGSARELADAPDWVKDSTSFRNTYCRLWWDRPCTTITTGFRTPSSSRCVHPKAARGLTTREAARVQGFPDRYVFKGPRASRELAGGERGAAAAGGSPRVGDRRAFRYG